MAVKALIMRIFTSIAVSDFNTLLSIATPFSVKAKGIYFIFCPRPAFKVAICDLEHSSLESSNMKSSGNLLILRLTCSFRRFVSTPYNRARSLSIITCWPRITCIRFSIGINAELLPLPTGPETFAFFDSSIMDAFTPANLRKTFRPVRSAGQGFDDGDGLGLVLGGGADFGKADCAALVDDDGKGKALFPYKGH